MSAGTVRSQRLSGTIGIGTGISSSLGGSICGNLCIMGDSRNRSRIRCCALNSPAIGSIAAIACNSAGIEPRRHSGSSLRTGNYSIESRRLADAISIKTGIDPRFPVLIDYGETMAMVLRYTTGGGGLGDLGRIGALGDQFLDSGDVVGFGLGFCRAENVPID